MLSMTLATAVNELSKGLTRVMMMVRGRSKILGADCTNNIRAIVLMIMKIKLMMAWDDTGDDDGDGDEDDDNFDDGIVTSVGLTH